MKLSKLIPQLYSSWVLLNIPPLTQAILQAPPLRGPYSLGTTTLELNDPNTSRTIMLSLFYPTPNTNAFNTTTYPYASVFPPQTAVLLAESFELPPSLVSNLTSRSHPFAPLRSPPSYSNFPLLLFSPGYGTSRLLYTSIVEELASLGYIVLTVDHPFDVPIIEYLNGTVALFNPPDILNYTQAIPYVDARVGDLRFVLDSLANGDLDSQVPGSSRLQTNFHKIGVLGHSLGGASAFSTILADSRFSCGVNLDGALIGNVVQKGLSAPMFIVGNELHNRTTDSTWSEFWGARKKGWRREVQIEGTTHQSFTDLEVWADVTGLSEVGNLTGFLGSIGGERILEFESVFVGGFFDKGLKGKREKILDGESKEWPEVEFEF